MAIANYQHVVDQLAREHPAEWARAHTGGAGTHDFIKRLAWVLHFQHDRAFGPTPILVRVEHVRWWLVTYGVNPSGIGRSARVYARTHPLPNSC